MNEGSVKTNLDFAETCVNKKRAELFIKSDSRYLYKVSATIFPLNFDFLCATIGHNGREINRKIIFIKKYSPIRTTGRRFTI